MAYLSGALPGLVIDFEGFPNTLLSMPPPPTFSWQITTDHFFDYVGMTSTAILMKKMTNMATASA